MAEIIEQQQIIQLAIQQTLQLLPAESGILYLLDTETEDLILEIALPDAADGDIEFANACLQQREPLTKLEGHSSSLIYIPLIMYESLLLGVMGFKLPTATPSAKDVHLLNLLANQTALILTNNRLLMRHELLDQKTYAEHKTVLTIYEAIPALETGESISAHLHHAAQIYHDLGWQAVRLTMADGSDQVIINSSQLPLPDLTSPLWQETLTNPIYHVGRGKLVVKDGLDLLFIEVQSPDGKEVLQIELYQTNDLNTINPQKIRPLLIFARQLGSAIEHSRLILSLRQTAQLLEEQVDELEFMRKADREISSRLDPDRIAQFTLDWAVRRTGADAGGIIVIDTLSHALTIKEAVGYPEEILNEPRFQNLNFGVVGRCISKKTKQLVEDVTQDPDYVAIIPKMVTQLAIPLISNKRMVGVITLESRVEGRFDDYATQFVERIASMTAIALDNAQLLQQAEQLADDMSIIYNAGRTISSSLEWEKTIQSIAQGMALAVKGSNALIYAYEPITQTARLLSVYTTDTTTATLPLVGSILDTSRYADLQTSIEQNHILLINQRSNNSPLQEWIQGMEYTNAAMTPLIAQGTAVGLAVLLKTNPKENFASSEIFVAESLATQAAAVLRQASLYSNILELETLKTEMIRMASHDLRAPIANISGFIELLEMDLEGSLTEDIQSYLESIRRSLHNMETLVEDLLTLEQIESQRSDSWETIAFENILHEVVDQQTTTARLKQQNLTAEFLDEPYPVRGHSTQLRQAVNNLIGNASKYTPEGGQVQVKIYRPNGQARLYFQVQDTGYGIPKARQDRIFQRFYRAKTAGTEHITGSGLGLSLVKSIIEKHGGEIWFESEEGVGSTFYFWLPLDL